MAVRPLDLQTEVSERPRLALVPAPPRRGRPFAALVVVILLAGLLGAPSLAAWAEGPPDPRQWSHRPPSSAQLTALHRGAALGTRIPRSDEPAGGILFVRCTNLWSALPDGSNARRILDIPGISSPTFSPDARSIAFFAPVDDGLAIWMAGADGSDPRVVAPLTVEGEPIDARAMNLTWSPPFARPRLLFALSDPQFDPWAGGSTIWTFDVETGEFQKHASGGVAPFWVVKRIGYASWSRTDGPTLWSVTKSGGRRFEGRMNEGDVAELTAFLATSHFDDAWVSGRSAVVLREREDGTRVLAVKRSEWIKGVRAEFEAPRGYTFSSTGRVALAQDGSRAIADLYGRANGRALGLLDLRTGEWTILGYAWEGTTSPAPTASGRLGGRRASRLAGDFLETIGRRQNSAAFVMIADDPDDSELVPARNIGDVSGTPTKADGPWHVPATVLMKFNRLDFAYRHLDLAIRETRDGRVTVDARPRSDIEPIVTIEDVQSMFSDVLGDRFAWPDLPAGTQLSKGWPVSMWSYGGDTQMSVQLTVPTSGRDEDLGIAFGNVDFSLGCGGELDPDDGTLSGTPAVFDSISPETKYERNQVIWPATVQDRSDAFYSVYGSLSRAEVARIAESMAR